MKKLFTCLLIFLFAACTASETKPESFYDQASQIYTNPYGVRYEAGVILAEDNDPNNQRFIEASERFPVGKEAYIPNSDAQKVISYLESQPGTITYDERGHKLLFRGTSEADFEEVEMLFFPPRNMISKITFRNIRPSSASKVADEMVREYLEENNLPIEAGSVSEYNRKNYDRYFQHKGISFDTHHDQDLAMGKIWNSQEAKDKFIEKRVYYAETAGLIKDLFPELLSSEAYEWLDSYVTTEKHNIVTDYEDTGRQGDYFKFNDLNSKVNYNTHLYERTRYSHHPLLSFIIEKKY